MFRQYTDLPRAVHLLCLGTFVNRAGTFVIPFLTIYIGERMAPRGNGADRSLVCLHGIPTPLSRRCEVLRASRLWPEGYGVAARLTWEA